jgi:hypothetical protein
VQLVIRIITGWDRMSRGARNDRGEELTHP